MRALLIALALFVAGSAWAVEPDEVLDDPILEARARDLSQEIRCLVCQNESIDSSGSGLARDLRILVRERLVAGDSDSEVKDFLVARYGDFVLLKPPFKPRTYLLWFGPALILLLGAGGLIFFFARQRKSQIEAAPLSLVERTRLTALLEQDGEAEPD